MQPSCATRLGLPQPQPGPAADSLAAPQVNRSLVMPGLRATWQPLFRRLDAGSPLRMAVLGASVAQEGGCLDQPSKRCMNYRDPQAAWAVRLLRHINRSWPSAAHVLTNGAADATALSHSLPCLFSHISMAIDLVILEAGSMARWLKLYGIEGVVRQLRRLRPPPVVITLSIYEWCKEPRCGPWADADAELRRVARHYGQPNVSPYAALREEVWSGRLAVADVVQDDDCLHPAGSRGARGARYIADMLEHCFDTARAAVGASSDKALLGARGVVANPHRDARREAAAELVLPAALHPEYERAGKYEASSCYLLGEQRGVNAQRRARLPWRTGRCTAAAAEPRASELCVTLPSRRQCPGWGSTQQQYDRFLATPPGDFFECNYALSPNASSRKVSEGLTALASGAVLDLGPLPAMRPPSMLAALEYLTSYSSTMGVARVTCLGGCACASHNINAREVGAAGERNVSVWREAELRILLPNVLPTAEVRPLSCTLRLRVLRQQDPTRGHKFKVRRLRVYSTSP